MVCLCKPLLNSHVFHRSPVCLAVDGSGTVHFGQLGTQLAAYETEVLHEKGIKIQTCTCLQYSAILQKSWNSHFV